MLEMCCWTAPPLTLFARRWHRQHSSHTRSCQSSRLRSIPQGGPLPAPTPAPGPSEAEPSRFDPSLPPLRCFLCLFLRSKTSQHLPLTQGPSCIQAPFSDWFPTTSLLSRWALAHGGRLGRISEWEGGVLWRHHPSPSLVHRDERGPNRARASLKVTQGHCGSIGSGSDPVWGYPSLLVQLALDNEPLLV